MGAPHIYSTSREVNRKRAIDTQITGGDLTKEYKIDMNSEDYLKQLIKLASRPRSRSAMRPAASSSSSSRAETKDSSPPATRTLTPATRYR